MAVKYGINGRPIRVSGELSTPPLRYVPISKSEKAPVREIIIHKASSLKEATINEIFNNFNWTVSSLERSVEGVIIKEKLMNYNSTFKFVLEKEFNVYVKLFS